jgi:hypothetical protein
VRAVAIRPPPAPAKAWAMLSDCWAALVAAGAGEELEEEEDRSPSVGAGASGRFFGVFMAVLIDWFEDCTRTDDMSGQMREYEAEDLCHGC